MQQFHCCSYSNNKNFGRLAFESKYSYLLSLYDDLQTLIKKKTTKLGKIKKNVQYSD